MSFFSIPESILQQLSDDRIPGVFLNTSLGTKYWDSDNRIKIELYRGEKAELTKYYHEQLLGFASNNQKAADFRVKCGSKVTAPIKLPWLDIEQAICIGGGADYGDDLWLMIDFRSDQNDPRVLANIFEWEPVDATDSVETNDGVVRGGSHKISSQKFISRTRRPRARALWLEISPKFSEFIRILASTSQ